MDTKITANKLGEYMTQSDPVRRRAIIRDQKNGNRAGRPRYSKAKPAIREALIASPFDALPLKLAIGRLKIAKDSTPWIDDDNRKSVEALEHFMHLYDKFPSSGLTYHAGEHQVARLNVAGMHVSVRPDLIIRGNVRGKDVCGAVKLHFTCDHKKALRHEGRTYVAALLYDWLALHGPTGAIPRPDLCLAVDVFMEEVTSAPNAHKRIKQQIQTACQEIRARWDTIDN